MKKLKYLPAIFAFIALIVIFAGCSEDFKVTFTVDEEIYSTMEIKKGEKIKFPEEPSKEGYTFTGWFIDEDNQLTSDTVVTKEINAQGIFEAINYDITYENVEGLDNSNPTTYNIETSLITLEEVSKDGYKFAGWFNDDDEKVTSISKGTTGDITLSAKWTKSTYSITYNDNMHANNPNPTGFDIDTATFPLVDLEKPGYKFEGWFNDDDKKVTSIPQGTIGDITLSAKWSKETYRITYNDELEVSNPNVDEFDIDTATFPLADLSKQGYIFEGWFNDDDEKVTSIPQGTVGDIDLNAKWSKETYRITYNDELEVSNPNVEEFDVETPTFSLADLSKPGYIFEGWFNEDDEKVTSIPKGTIGSLDLDAKWSKETYRITYNGELQVSNPNVDEFDVETPTFTLIDLSKPGYIFEGWFNGISKITTIEKGTIGSLDLDAKWSKKTYRITYNDELKVSNPNVDEFDVETPTFTLIDLEKPGYIFEGWFIDQKEVTEVQVGSIGNIVLDAKWSKETYRVTYNDEFKLSNPNVDEFDVETPTFSLVDLEKLGYIFEGWFDAQEEEVTEIKVGTANNITLTAKWKVRDYSITYKNADNLTNPNPTTYNIETATINLEEIERDSYIFMGWFNGEKEVTFIEKGTTGNIELEAHWLSEENINKITYTDISRNCKESEKPTTATFNAHCYDSEGKTLDVVCTINGTYSAGKTVSITLSVEGNNNVQSVTLNDFKVYGLPTITSEMEDKIYSNANLATIFVAKDSFGTIIEDVVTSTDKLVLGEVITVTATDVAGNKTTKEYEVIFENRGVFLQSEGTITGLTEYGKTLNAIAIPAEVDNVAVSIIGNDAFNGNTVLESITIPGTIQTVGYRAFKNCTNLKTVTIENGVSVIMDYAFDECSSIESIVIPESITTINTGMFARCTSLKSAIFKGSIDVINEDAFFGCENLESFDIDENVTIIKKNAFYYCKKLETINIPASVSEIGERAFYYCTNLKTITLNEGLKKLGWRAFGRCESLENIVLPTSLQTMSGHLFENCFNLKSIIIPLNVTTMEQYVFAGCPSNIVINCCASSKPEGWDENWNTITAIGTEKFAVNWNYK